MTWFVEQLPWRHGDMWTYIRDASGDLACYSALIDEYVGPSFEEDYEDDDALVIVDQWSYRVVTR